MFGFNEKIQCIRGAKMSKWNHVSATIFLDVKFEEEKLALYNIIESILFNAPKITGSEKDADVFVNILSGYSGKIYKDCERCVYKDTVQGEGNSFSCEADEEFECPSREFQDGVVITIAGDLRDKHYLKTKQELDEFLIYIMKELTYEPDFDIKHVEESLCIRAISGSITDDCGKIHRWR